MSWKTTGMQIQVNLSHTIQKQVQRIRYRYENWMKNGIQLGFYTYLSIPKR